MSRKKNILFLASWYPNKKDPKAGNFIQRHAEAIKLKHNIFVLYVGSHEQEEKQVIDIRQKNGIYEVILYYKKVKNKIPGLSQFIKYRRLMNAYKYGYNLILKESCKIDLVHLNVAFPAGLFAEYLKKKYKFKYILTEHSTTFLPISPLKFGLMEGFLIKKIANKASCVCPVSKDLGNAMRQFGIENKYEVVYNVVDENIFQYQPSVEKSKELRLIHISNFKEEHKNISGMLNVIKKLTNQLNDFVVTFAGDGDTEHLENQVKEINIPDKNIKIEGSKSSKEVAALMNQNDAFLLFSHYENLPCVVAESLITGTPVISSDVNGIKEMIDETNGLLVEDNDEEALLKKIIFFQKNKMKYSAQSIRKDALKRYSKEAVSERFDKIYQSLID